MSGAMTVPLRIMLGCLWVAWGWWGVGLPAVGASEGGQKPAEQLVRKQDKAKVIPRVLTKAEPDNVSILISLGKQRAYLLVGEEVAIDSPVSTGKRGAPTPKGSFTILQKNRDHRSSIYGDFVDKQGRVVRSGVSTKSNSAPSGTRFRGAPMKYFQRLTWDGIGLHVGKLPGYPASHGCIRLPEEIARLFFEHTRLGTAVVVQD
jgi:lipoprotein-anchoring transpeptidase ErfK/SrfK